MKTKLFLFAALIITTITFSQTSNKAELIDAMAKDANLSKADVGKALNIFGGKKGYDHYVNSSNVSNSQARSTAVLGTDRAKVATSRAIHNDCDDDCDGVPTQTGATIKINSARNNNDKPVRCQSDGGGCILTTNVCHF